MQEQHVRTDGAISTRIYEGPELTVVQPVQVFTNAARFRALFPRVRSGALMECVGFEFFWQKLPGEPLI